MFLIFDITLVILWGKQNFEKDDGSGTDILNSRGRNFLKPKRVLATVPESMCLEYLPGIPQNADCGDGGGDANMGQASSVVDVLADALLESTRRTTASNSKNISADLSLIHAGMAHTDIEIGDFTVQHATDLLGDRFFNEPIVILKVTGQQLRVALEQGVETSILNLQQGKDQIVPSYPFGAGIRYDVDISEATMKRVTNIQVLENVDDSSNRRSLRGTSKSSSGRDLVNTDVDADDGSWVQLDLQRVYSVVTTQHVAQGGHGYSVFASVLRESGVFWLDHRHGADVCAASGVDTRDSPGSAF